MGTGEWAQFHRRIPVRDYATLAHTFTAKNFDADRITDLACEVGMRYVTLVACHHEGFALWGSPSEPFNSVNACGRDLVGEMAQQCARKGLGFFTYYTFMLNWRYPHFLSPEIFRMARPHYTRPQPEYLSDDVEGFRKHYVPYMLGHLRELLTGYGPLAGMWLDIIMAYYLRPDLVPVRAAYDLIRQLQPATLLCYKQGATGEEDFATPEHRFQSLAEAAGKMGGEAAARRADAAWEKNRHKHNEICTTLQKGGPWGWKAEAEHASADEVWAMLAHAHAHNCNLLANVGPLADGSLHPEDVAALREVGRRVRVHGWPGPEEATLPGAPDGAAQ
ncbi:MAG: alpha-L-fucosidase, partial [Armatimonadota bacterium]|nr:alpha-L-fucosidase [Armatimonadota bacterium]